MVTIFSTSLIKFPLFELPEEPIILGDKLMSKGRVYDDLSIDKATLGKRRLHMESKARLSKIVYNTLQLVKVAKGHKSWYLDRYGNVYCYIKTRNETLKTHKILEKKLMGTYSILKVDGIDFPFLARRPPSESYARILYIEEYPWEIYDYVNDPGKPSTKKV